MCFFKTPKMPDFKTPERPAVTETTAPEPQAPVFGTSENAKATEEGVSGKKGTSSVKIDIPKPVTATTGASSYGLNARR